MSDSSEDEDLSRFKEAVDTSFVKLIDETRSDSVKLIKNEKPHSQRYLDVTGHYNDVRVSKEMQKRIGDKISTIINKLVEYVDVEHSYVKKHKIKGGIKLFRDSEGFLSSEERMDSFTEVHNSLSKKIKMSQKKKRLIDDDVKEPNESDKIKSVVLSGEYVLSKEETRHWRSRRKDKVFKYNKVGNNKNGNNNNKTILISV